MQGKFQKTYRLFIIAFICMSTLFTVGYAPKAVTATALYPNLKTLPPRDLRFDRADVSVDGSGVMHNVLRFSNTVYNVGEGKMEMRGTIDPVTQDGNAYQRVYNTDGTYTDYKVGVFYYHPQHKHYHFEDWGQYQLWTKAEYDKYIASGKTQGQYKKAGVKTTSCVMDEEFILTLSGTPYPAQYPFGGCSPNSQNQLMEGLSIGWGDTYDYYRFEQWIDLDQETLADGDYVLRSITDPLNKMYESANKQDDSRESVDDNQAIVNFTVSGGVILDGSAPGGSVSINHVDTTTVSPNVVVSVIGRDDVSGVDKVKLSNDGSSWATYTYTGVQSQEQSISWDLSDPLYGGNANGGVKTVYATFLDKSGKLSPVQSDTIYFDPATSVSSAAVLADNPVSYWRLSETSGTTAMDTRAANNGVYTNGPTLGVPGLIASDPSAHAVQFDGVDDYVGVNNSASLGMSSSVSLEAWINPESIPASGSSASVITKPKSFTLQFSGPKLEFSIIQNGTRQKLLAPIGAISIGQKYHVVGVYDGATEKLYINGLQVASKTLIGNITTSNSKLYIGSWNGSTDFFKGTIDEVAIYNFALSGNRVKAHFDAATAGYSISGNAGVAGATLSYTDGSAKTATADGSGLYSFQVSSNWSGTVTPSKAGYTFSPASRTYSNMTSDQTGQNYTASVSSVTLSVNKTGNGTGTVTSSPAGINCGSICSASYNYGTVVTLTATADTGFIFTGWSGACAGTGTCQVTMDAAKTATADFGTTSPGYQQRVIADNPVSYWRLGETSGTIAVDAMSKNNGTYMNGPQLGYPGLLTNDANSAVNFDGTNDQVKINNSTSLNITSAITLEGWVNPASLPATGTFASIISKSNSYSLQFNGPSLELTIIQNTTRRRCLAPSGAIVTGQKYYVVGTFDGVNQNLYINGALAASCPLTGAITTGTNNVFIASWNANTEFFKGVIDEVAIYNVALTAAQVQEHYDAR